MRYIGDPVVAVAALTRAQAKAAAAAVKIEYELLPELDTPEKALAPDAARIHADRPNLCYKQPQIKGDADAAFAGSAAVVEAHFDTQINHQAAMEPEACVAYLEGEGDDAQLVVIGRSINIHKTLQVLQEGVGWENMRYEEAFSGGQFGMKLDISSEGIAAVAALHFGRPVRYIPSIIESMQMTSKRHEFHMDVKLAADADGHITAYQNHFTVDNGAYHSNGDTICLRALFMLSGSYNIPNVDASATLVYTNNPWGSAARGAGAPQVNFALESAMDMLARKLGIDPFDFRVKNLLQVGQTKSTGQPIEEWAIGGLYEAMRPHYDRAVKEAREASTPALRRGVGLASGSFGIGGPGDMGTVAVELEADGTVTIYGAVADPGEGNDSMLTQLTADTLGISMDRVRLWTRDTDHTAASGPAAASRLTYMAGGALMDALRQLKEAMEAAGATTHEQMKAAGAKTRFVGVYRTALAGPLDPETGQGPSFESEVHAVQLAEVEVDTETRRRPGGQDDHSRGRRHHHPSPERHRAARRWHGHGHRAGAARAVRRRADQGLGDLQVPDDADLVRHGGDRPRDASHPRPQGRGGRGRDDPGADGARDHERHRGRMRRAHHRPSGHAGQGQSGAGRGRLELMEDHA